MTESIVTRIENAPLSREAAELLKAGIDRQVIAARQKASIGAAARWFELGLDPPDSRTGRPDKPYSQVELVFVCVTKLIAAIQALPLVLSTADDKIVESGPVYDLFFNNAKLSWPVFVRDTIGHYALTGDVFWVFTDTVGTRPTEITVVSGSQMHPVTHNRQPDGVLLGWEFRSGSQRVIFSPDELHQWKNFNPYDRFHGAGPVDAADRSIHYDHAASLFNTACLDNGAEPGLILTAPAGVSEDDVERLRTEFMARHAGPDKAKRPVVLSGIEKIETLAQSMVDMEVSKISELQAKKLCSAFGVPPGVAGLITEAQYSHGPAMQDFIFNTVLPLASLFAGELTAGIISRFFASDQKAVSIKDITSWHGRRLPLSVNRYYRQSRQKAAVRQNRLFAWLDASAHPVVQAHDRETAEKVLRYTDSGVPLNQIIGVYDLPFEEVPWGDDWWISAGLMPARYTLEAGPEGLTGPPYTPPEEGEEEGEASLDIKAALSKDDRTRRLRLWNNWVLSWAGLEREYREAMRKFFIRQQRILLTLLKRALSDAKAGLPTCLPSQRDRQTALPACAGSTADRPGQAGKADPDAVIGRVVFDLAIEDGKIKALNADFFRKGSELGIRQSLTELAGLTGDKLTDAARSLASGRRVRERLYHSATRITEVNRTTQNLVARTLRRGLEAGEDLKQLSARVKNVTGSNLPRAQRIARTQAAGAVGTGRHAGMEAAGTDLKSWVTAGDENVRSAHTQAGRDYAAGIPLKSPFIVAGEALMYPADPSGSAANIINCRCCEIALAASKSYFAGNFMFYRYSPIVKGA